MNPPMGVSSELLWWLLQVTSVALAGVVLWQIQRVLRRQDAHEVRLNAAAETLARLDERTQYLAEQVGIARHPPLRSGGASGD